MSHQHAVVWLDHREARVIDFSIDDVHKAVVRHHGGHRQVHHKSGSVGSGHSKEDAAFFDEVCASLGDAGEVLLTGPGLVKTALRHHIEQRKPLLAKRVVGVETLDHPGDAELLAFARKYFDKVDRMMGTSRQVG